MSARHPAVPRRSGFTVVELMIGVGIIAILSAIAIPGYLEARSFGMRSAYANELRTTHDAFQQFVAERNSLPPTAINTVPDDMDNFMPKNSTWTIGPDIGGRWAWVNSSDPAVAGITALQEFRGWIFTSAIPINTDQITRIDQSIDDGDANSGAFRFADNGDGTHTALFGVN